MMHDDDKLRGSPAAGKWLVSLFLVIAGLSYASNDDDHKIVTQATSDPLPDYCSEENTGENRLFDSPPILKPRFREITPARGPKNETVIEPAQNGSFSDPYDDRITAFERERIEREVASGRNAMTYRVPRQIRVGTSVDMDAYCLYAERALRCEVKEEGTISTSSYVSSFKNHIENELLASSKQEDPAGMRGSKACMATTATLFSIEDKEIQTGIADQLKARLTAENKNADPEPTDGLMKVANRLRKKQNEIAEAHRMHTRAPIFDENEAKFLALLFDDRQRQCAGMDALFGTGPAAFLRDYIGDRSSILDPHLPQKPDFTENDFTRPGASHYLFDHFPFKDKPSFPNFLQRMNNLLQVVPAPGKSPPDGSVLATYPFRPSDMKDLTIDRLKELQHWLQAQIKTLESFPSDDKPWTKGGGVDVKWWRRPLLKEILERSSDAIDGEIAWRGDYKSRAAAGESAQEYSARLQSPTTLVTRPYFAARSEQREAREVENSPEYFSKDVARLERMRSNLNNVIGADLNSAERLAYEVADPLHQSVLENMVHAHSAGERKAEDNNVLALLAKSLSGVALVEALANNPRLRASFAHVMADTVENPNAHADAKGLPTFDVFFGTELEQDPAFLAALVIQAAHTSASVRGEIADFLGGKTFVDERLALGPKSDNAMLGAFTKELVNDKALREKLIAFLLTKLKDRGANVALTAFYDLLTQTPDAESAGRARAVREHLVGRGNETFRTWFADMALQVSNDEVQASRRANLQALAKDLKAAKPGTPEYEAAKKKFDDAANVTDWAARTRSSLAWTVALIDRLGHTATGLRTVYGKTDPFAAPLTITQQIIAERQAVLEAAGRLVPILGERIYSQKAQGKDPAKTDYKKLYEEAVQEANKLAPGVVRAELAKEQDPFFFLNANERSKSPLAQPVTPGHTLTPQEEADRSAFAAQSTELSHIISEAGPVGIPSPSRVALLGQSLRPEEVLMRSHIAEQVYGHLAHDVAADTKDSDARLKLAKKNYEQGLAEFRELILDPAQTSNRSRRTEPDYYNYVVDHQQRERLRESLMTDLATFSISHKGELSPEGKTNLAQLTLAEMKRRGGALNSIITKADLESKQLEPKFVELQQEILAELRLQLADRLKAENNMGGAVAVLRSFPGVTDDAGARSRLDQDAAIRAKVFSSAGNIKLPPTHLDRRDYDQSVDEEALQANLANQSELIVAQEKFIRAAEKVQHLSNEVMRLTTEIFEKGPMGDGRTNGPLVKLARDLQEAEMERVRLGKNLDEIRAQSDGFQEHFDARIQSREIQKFANSNHQEWDNVAEKFVDDNYKGELEQIKDEAQKNLKRTQLIRGVRRALLAYQESRERPKELAAAGRTRGDSANPIDWTSPSLAPLRVTYDQNITAGTTPFYQPESAKAALAHAEVEARETAKREEEQIKHDADELARVGIEVRNGMLMTSRAAYDHIANNQNWSGGMEHLKEIFQRLGRLGIRYDMRPDDSPWLGFQNYIISRFNEKEKQTPSFEISGHSGVTVSLDRKTMLPSSHFWDVKTQSALGHQLAIEHFADREVALKANRDYRRQNLPLLGGYFSSMGDALNYDYKYYTNNRGKEEADSKVRTAAYNALIATISHLQSLGNTLVTDPKTNEQVAAQDLAVRYRNWVKKKYLDDDRTTNAQRLASDLTGVEAVADAVILLSGIATVPKLAAKGVTWAKALMNPLVRKMAAKMAVPPAVVLAVMYDVQNKYSLPKQNAEWVQKFVSNGKKPILDESIPYFLDQNYNGVPDTEENETRELEKLQPRIDQWYPMIASSVRTGLLFPVAAGLEGAQAPSVLGTMRHMGYVSAAEGLFYRVGIKQENVGNVAGDVLIGTALQAPSLFALNLGKYSYGMRNLAQRTDLNKWVTKGAQAYVNRPNLNRWVSVGTFAGTGYGVGVLRQRVNALMTGRESPEEKDIGQQIFNFVGELAPHLAYGYMMTSHLNAQVAAEELMNATAPKLRNATGGYEVVNSSERASALVESIVKKYDKETIAQALYMIGVGRLNPDIVEVGREVPIARNAAGNLTGPRAPNSANGTLAIEYDPNGVPRVRGADPSASPPSTAFGPDPRAPIVLRPTSQDPIFDLLGRHLGFTGPEMRVLISDYQQGRNIEGRPTWGFGETSGRNGTAVGGAPEQKPGISGAVQPQVPVLWAERGEPSEAPGPSLWQRVVDIANKPIRGTWVAYDGPLRTSNIGEQQPSPGSNEPWPAWALRTGNNLRSGGQMQWRQNEPVLYAGSQAVTGVYKYLRQGYLRGNLPFKDLQDHPGVFGTFTENETDLNKRELATAIEQTVEAYHAGESAREEAKALAEKKAREKREEAEADRANKPRIAKKNDKPVIKGPPDARFGEWFMAYYATQRRHHPNSNRTVYDHYVEFRTLWEGYLDGAKIDPDLIKRYVKKAATNSATTGS
jgi:hypothetical protein